MKKTIIENFEKNENEIKVALLKEIRESFENYKTKEVLFYTIFDYENIEGFDELERMMHDVCPQILNYNNLIDATALPHSICNENDELILRVYGNYSNPNIDYITLEKNSYGLTVNGLYNILLLLRHPTFKRIKKKLDKDENQ